METNKMYGLNQTSGRRAFLAGALCVPLAGTAGVSRAMTAPSINPTDIRENLRTYMLLRGALDEKLVISCITCQFYGVVDGVMTPFYDLVAATFSKYRATKNGGYDAVTFEIEYFIDRETGDVLDKWRNPYSGEIVTAKHNDSVPMKIRIEPNGTIAMPPAILPPGSKVAREAPHFQIVGNDIWVKEKSEATILTTGAKPTHFNEFVGYHAKRSALDLRGQTRIQSDTTYLGISSFRPWQMMGDRPGHMIGYGLGGNGVAMADLPAQWLAITKRRHPEALVAPDAY